MEGDEAQVFDIRHSTFEVRRSMTRYSMIHDTGTDYRVAGKGKEWGRKQSVQRCNSATVQRCKVKAISYSDSDEHLIPYLILILLPHQAAPTRSEKMQLPLICTSNGQTQAAMFKRQRSNVKHQTSNIKHQTTHRYDRETPLEVPPSPAPPPLPRLFSP